MRFFSDSPLSHDVHDIGYLEIHGAGAGTGITGRAQPNGGTLEYFALKSGSGHVDQPSGRIVHKGAERTCTAARAALDAVAQIFSAGYTGYPLGKGWVHMCLILDLLF